MESSSNSSIPTILKPSHSNSSAIAANSELSPFLARLPTRTRNLIPYQSGKRVIIEGRRTGPTVGWRRAGRRRRRRPWGRGCHSPHHPAPGVRGMNPLARVFRGLSVLREMVPDGRRPGGRRTMTNTCSNARDALDHHRPGPPGTDPRRPLCGRPADHPRRARAQPQGRLDRPAARLAHRLHRPLRQRQVLAGLRHDLRPAGHTARRAAPRSSGRRRSRSSTVS